METAQYIRQQSERTTLDSRYVTSGRDGELSKYFVPGIFLKIHFQLIDLPRD